MKKLLALIIITFLFVGCSPKEETGDATLPVEENEVTETPTEEPSSEATEAVNILEAENEKAKEKIDELETEITHKDKEIDNLKNELDELAKELDDEKNKEANITPTSSGTSKFYHVICGSFSNMTNANKQKDLLKAAGFDSYVLHSGDYYRVISGSFKNKANADKQEGNLEKAGYDAFVIYSN
ncbi:SPOR domain-containing protein [Vallitalea okinawensis]|uniref:SPOR domain-containing protein n=1 Tax=Vallitalea okinawensis TaxID=2078660 RepID=UPI000CFB6735|nr:SPOR domain-containing protein [Vallitalea okinawensis]